MELYKLGEIEEQFADIIWREEPLGSGKLVALCEKELNWKKSTTYTILRKLCEKGIFKNENTIVSSQMSKAEYNAIQGEQFINCNYKGSLPAFIAAFVGRRKLTKEEFDDIRKLMAEYEENDK